VGRRVVKPGGPTPPKYRTIVCGECGAPRRVINGTWLRFRRESRELDQRAFARRLGISGPYLSDLERNRRDCPAVILRAYEGKR
jgi:DNA-binding transcriptional regulator YiaG